jgi:acetyltransferase AlgX (SGNH hydrolase-like protein)
LAREKHTRLFLTIAFLLIIFGVGLFQAGLELSRGERPQCLELFRRAPSADNLRTYEEDLEDASLIVQALRAPMQHLQFATLRDTGEKALLGRDGWFFFKPGVQYLTQPPKQQAQSFQAGPVANRTEAESQQDPLAAIVSFRDMLAERGIHLLVLPAPGKASVYPDMLTSRALDAQDAVNPETVQLLDNLKAAGVEVVNLFDLFKQSRQDESNSPLYLAQDTHWSPEGMHLAAQTVAQRLLDLGWVEEGTTSYTLEPAPLRRHGDVIRMMNAPRIEQTFAPEEVRCAQVVTPGTGAPYTDSTESDILVLGDSFLRIYETDEPGSAGFIAHLAHALGTPLASIVNDGGASTLVRQQLYSKPELLEGKKVVIWEFVERDIRFGTEGWQDVPLPKAS